MADENGIVQETKKMLDEELAPVLEQADEVLGDMRNNEVKWKNDKTDRSFDEGLKALSGGESGLVSQAFEDGSEEQEHGQASEPNVLKGTVSDVPLIIQMTMAMPAEGLDIEMIKAQPGGAENLAMAVATLPGAADDLDDGFIDREEFLNQIAQEAIARSEQAEYKAVEPRVSDELKNDIADGLKSLGIEFDSEMVEGLAVTEILFRDMQARQMEMLRNNDGSALTGSFNGSSSGENSEKVIEATTGNPDSEMPEADVTAPDTMNIDVQLASPPMR